MEIPGVPATQVRGDEMEPSNLDGAPGQSTSRCQRRAKHASATRVHVPPVAVREARNLLHFFPLPQQAEEEVVLEPEAEDRNEDLLEV